MLSGLLAPAFPGSLERGADSGESFLEHGLGKLPQLDPFAQDLQFLALPPTIRNRNRPAKQVGDQRWLNQHSMNRGSTRQSVLCAVSASPECLMNRGELHRLRTGSPAHRPRPSGPGSTLPSRRFDFLACGLFSVPLSPALGLSFMHRLQGNRPISTACAAGVGRPPLQPVWRPALQFLATAVS
jgi:hypothetical protein